MRLFDTHAHLDSGQLKDDLDAIIENAVQADVVGIVAIGTTVSSSRDCLEIARRHRFVWAAVGIHPNECLSATQSDWAQIRKLAADPKTVAIGETGLDRYWDDCPIDIQKQWFERHIELSAETGKPLVIHMRDCEADILESLRLHAKQHPIHGIMHSFTGSIETAQQCLEWGMHISFSGMVTFKKSNELRAIAKQIPDDRILIETDSPYLSPHPHRGQRPNQPALVQHTAACLAEVRDTSLEEFGERTTQNACRVFGVTPRA